MESAEVFKPFPMEEYKSLYLVSSKGEIYSKKVKRYIKTTVTNNHNVCDIEAIKYRVDELVATAFYGNSDLYLEHIDGNLSNDQAKNLTWIEIIEYLKNRFGCEWKKIQDFEHFCISTTGKVWSIKMEQLLKSHNNNLYEGVVLHKDNKTFGKKIHRLVAENFIPNPDNLPIVNHIDGNKLNNNLENLEWVTNKENVLHGLTLGPRKAPRQIIYSKLPNFSVELECLLDYYITIDGKIYSKNNRGYLNLAISDGGYYCINIKKKKYYAHRLVAMAYLDTPPPEKNQVNHIDGNKLNNHVSNLEWVTHNENSKHSKQTNPQQYAHLQKKVAMKDINTGEIIKIFNGLKEAAKFTKVNSGSICRVCKGRQKTAGGYKWEYIEEESRSDV